MSSSIKEEIDDHIPSEYRENQGQVHLLDLIYTKVICFQTSVNE